MEGINLRGGRHRAVAGGGLAGGVQRIADRDLARAKIRLETAHKSQGLDDDILTRINQYQIATGMGGAPAKRELAEAQLPGGSVSVFQDHRSQMVQAAEQSLGFSPERLVLRRSQGSGVI